MELLEFRKVNVLDKYDESFNDGFAWSRIYEYPLVISLIEKYKGNSKDLLIHNSSWGFTGVHVTFKNFFDSIYPNTVHSDIKPSSLSKTFVYNITEPPTEDIIEKFDIVLNISTVEEVQYDQMKIFENLFKQVKKDGLLILTFDIPGLELNNFEAMFNKKIETSDNDLNGLNSKLVNKRWSGLNCGFMVVKK